MKKKLSCLLLTLVLVIGALTGCMGSNTALVLNADGTCVYTVKYMYEKETFQTTLDEAKDKSPLFGGDFTRAEETVGDMTYYTFSRQLTFASVDAMKTALTDLTAYINRM